MRRAWPWITALLVLVALPHWAVLLGRAAYCFGDMKAWFLPVHVFSADQLAEGNLTPWCWLVGCGFPFWAEPQAGTFYPPNLLFLIGLPPGLVMGWLLWAHYALAALGVWVLARRLGCSRLGALLAGSAFAASGFMTAHLGAYALVCAAAWLPWWWYALVRWREQPDWAGPALIVLCSAAQLLCGHPHVWFISLLASVCFGLLYRPPRPAGGGAGVPVRRRLWWAMAPLAAALLGLAVSAVQSVPTAVLTEQSIRRAGCYQFVIDYALKPKDLVALVDRERADRIGVERTGYLGAGVLLLALVGGVRRRWDASDRVLWAMAIIALAMALATLNPLYHLLWHIPFVSGMRCACRWLLVWGLSISLLAGLSLTRFQRAEVGPGLHRLRTALLLLFAVHYLQWHLLMLPGAIIVWWEGLADRLPPAAFEYFAQAAYLSHDMIGMAGIYPPIIASLLLLSMLGPAARGQRPRAWVLGALLTVSLAEALWSGTAYKLTSPPETQDPRDPALTAVPRDDRTLTAVGLGPTLTNKTMLDGVAVPDCYGALVLSRHLDLINGLRSHGDAVAAAVVGARWWVTPDEVARDAPGWRQVRRIGEKAILANEHCRGLAWPVFRVESEQRMRELLDSDQDDRAELLQAAFLKDPGAISLPSAGATGQATLLRQDGRGYAFDCEMGADGLLVITSCWYPGVYATVDGQPAQVLEANIAFCAVPVPAGAHRVELGYAPAGLRTGLVVSAIALVLAVLGLWLLRRAQLKSA